MNQLIKKSIYSTLFLVGCLPMSGYSETYDWSVFGGNWLHQRHSQASQITPENVGKLAPAWEYDTGIKATFQATPIVQNGVMYVSLPFNHVVALNAKTGQALWRYTHERLKDRTMCCGPSNRGVAVEAGKVFMGTVDGRLVALSAKTGEKLWDIDVIQGDQGIPENLASLAGQTEGKVSGASGAGLNMAPMVYKGKVLIGITGVGYGLHLETETDNAPLGAVVGIAGKYGRRGFLAAYDMNTGERQWKFDTVAANGWEGEYRQTTPDGEYLPRDIAAEKAAAAQHADAWKYGGGSAWSTPAIDRSTDTLFFGTGNPSPQMEGSSRPGDNLYTSSLVALNIETGQLKWHYQQVPHDLWGYDVASPPVLFNVRQGERFIPAVGQAGKTGWFYVHDRATGQLLFKSDPFVPQYNQFERATKAGIEIYPGVVGGSNWSPVSVDEERRSVFVAGIHWPVNYQLHEVPAKGKQAALSYSSMSPSQDKERYGILSAIDLDSGKLKWRYKTRNPLIGGVLSTATGLVFIGQGEGKLVAHNASNGQKLWEGLTDAGVNAPPITYELDGKQYVAVAAGGNKLFGFKTGQKIRVWALPD